MYQQPQYPIMPPPDYSHPKRWPWLLIGMLAGMFICVATTLTVASLAASNSSDRTFNYEDIAIPTSSVASSTKVTVKFYASPAPPNPYNYDFNEQDGFLIEYPPDDFCKHFACTPNFWQEQGYIVQCKDGMYSKSGGEDNACANNGGAKQILYWH